MDKKKEMNALLSNKHNNASGAGDKVAIVTGGGSGIGFAIAL